MLAEVVLRPRLKPIRSSPQVDLVGVQLKDLILRESSLDLHRQNDLLELAPEGLLVGQKQIPCQLHRDRRRTLRPLLIMKIAIRRTNRAKQVHTPVALK